MQYLRSARRLEDWTRALSWKQKALLPRVIATVSLASLSGFVLPVSSRDIPISLAIFTARGSDPSVAATAGLLSAMISIWLLVPISLIALAFNEHAGKDRSVGI